MKPLRLLTLNSHEAYVYSLSRLGHHLDIIDQLPGRYTKSWDKRIRPVPENCRLLTLNEAYQYSKEYDCLIAHSIDDLLLFKAIPLPKIVIIHISLTGYVYQEGNKVELNKARVALNTYLQKIQALAVSVSKMKSLSSTSQIRTGTLAAGVLPSV